VTKSQIGGKGKGNETAWKATQGPSAKEGGLYLDICAGIHATADGAGLPT